jgi:hypothetical protein
MTDRELLELAAKAAGYTIRLMDREGRTADIGPDRAMWEPLDDDGDALRLAVKLGISVAQEVARGEVYADVCDTSPTIGADEPFGADPYAATRRAITRAAAEIGKGMP